jgi:hypothetical protein
MGAHRIDVDQSGIAAGIDGGSHVTGAGGQVVELVRRSPVRVEPGDDAAEPGECATAKLMGEIGKCGSETLLAAATPYVDGREQAHVQARERDHQANPGQRHRFITERRRHGHGYRGPSGDRQKRAEHDVR